MAYAIWSDAGIVLIIGAAYMLHRQALDTPAIIGIALILLGVAIINLFSKSVAH